MDAIPIDSPIGSRPTPLLPRSLREAWRAEVLPPWFAAEMGLTGGATAAALDQAVWQRPGVTLLSDRQRNFLLNLVGSRRSEIGSLKVFSQPVPYWLDLKKLDFSRRTSNCLNIGKLLDEPERLSSLTFADLFAIRGMGMVSILEFACTVEAALEWKSSADAQGASLLMDDEVLAIIAEPWADQVGPCDPRFADLIPPAPRATVLEILDNLISGPSKDVEVLEKVRRKIPGLRKRLAEIAALPLETQLREFLRSVSGFEGERLQALIDRFGWGGVPPITLEEAGKQLGLTRERIRQLQKRLTNKLGAIPFPVYMPGLDDALRVLVEASPLLIDAAEALLIERGITVAAYHPGCVIAAAIACGRKPAVELQTIKQRTIVVASKLQYVDDIMRVAYRQAHASGASNVDEVVAEMAAAEITVDAEEVRRSLQDFSDVSFLQEDWFGHCPDNPERDRLRNVTRKILSVAAPIGLGVIREGVRREYRYRGHRGLKTWSLLVPPKAVLHAYYDKHPEFLVDDDTVKPVEPLDYRLELGLNAAILVDVLRSSPACVLDRASFATECLRRSMNANSFSLYLTYSPVIVHLGTDIWSLRGVRVDPAAVEAVRTANALKPREKRVLDHGWTTEGDLWLAARIPAAHVANLVVSVPEAIRLYLSGREFAAADEDGVAYGTIKVNTEGSSYGFAPFLRQHGADEGDIIIAEFNLSSGAALLRLGNDELLEEMSPEA